jgi:predicted signal transduction protein with EAL and GGDEF domain
LHAAAPVILPQKSLFNLRVDTMAPLLGPVGAHLIGGGLRVRALSAPCAIDGHEVRIGITIGIALAPRDGVTFDRLAACADDALYQAKHKGRGSVVCAGEPPEPGAAATAA